MNISNQKKSQDGSIMLEVIAVLALMGVMGAMLFRQIYQRNQELHNIQMASEIRTIKEAFSACLQARTQEINTHCGYATTPGVYNECTDDFLKECTEGYLPDGWFDSGLDGYYDLHQYSYLQGTEETLKMYGVVVPVKDMILPKTGWTFKRAARVALLVGADGGVYGDITGGEIAGSMGTWHLDPIAGMNADDNLYVAITGLDIFTPEKEPVTATVNLSDNWNLQLQDLNVYRYFSVAGADSGCFDPATDIKHTNAPGGIVENDTVATPATAGCIPNFWVDSNDNTGQVYTRNDLNVGVNDANPTGNPPAIRLSSKGAIIFAETDTDPDPLDNVSKNYVLDPAYTSIMNDIKLVSRGGARLSQILPNYILKSMGEETLTTAGVSITMPSDCPSGYKRALLIIPHLEATTDKLKATTSKPDTSLSADPTNGDVEVVEEVEQDGDKNNTVIKTKLSANTEQPTTTLSYDGAGDVDVVKSIPTITVSVAGGAYGSDYSKQGNLTDNFTVKSTVAGTKVSYQTFCVFNSADFTLPTAVRADKTFAKSESECKALGGTWSGTACT